MEPCPLLDFTGGFNKFLAAAYGLASGETISSRFGKPFGGAPFSSAPCKSIMPWRRLALQHNVFDTLCEGTSDCKAPPESTLGLSA